MIFSEKEAAWSKFSEQVGVGDVYEARVGSVEDYGAFVHLRFSDGNILCSIKLLILFADVFRNKLPLTFQNSAGLYHLTGLVHVSEVSWDLVQDVRDILSEGDEVTVKVINVDRQVVSDSFLLPTNFHFL